MEADPQCCSWVPSDRWLVVSACDGVGGIFLALQLLGRSFEGLAAEKDRHLQEFSHGKFPHVLLHKEVASLTADCITAYFRRCDCVGIFLDLMANDCAPFSESVCPGCHAECNIRRTNTWSRSFRLWSGCAVGAQFARSWRVGRQVGRLVGR